MEDDWTWRPLVGEIPERENFPNILARKDYKQRSLQERWDDACFWHDQREALEMIRPCSETWGYQQCKGVFNMEPWRRKKEVDPRQPGVEQLRVNGGDLLLPRGRRLKVWRKTMQGGESWPAPSYPHPPSPPVVYWDDDDDGDDDNFRCYKEITLADHYMSKNIFFCDFSLFFVERESERWTRERSLSERKRCVCLGFRCLSFYHKIIVPTNELHTLKIIYLHFFIWNSRLVTLILTQAY